MKLRMRDHSIRLRLTQSEVDWVRDDGVVRGRVAFGGDSYFDYLLQSSPEIASTMAKMFGNVLTVGVPESDMFPHPQAGTENC